MAASKCKGFPRKKRSSELDVVVSSLRKENAFLKKSLVGLSRQHCDHYKLLERLLNLDTAKLDNSQQLADKDKKTALPSELSEIEDNPTDAVSMERVSGYARKVEQIENRLVSISTKCQFLERKVAGKKDFKADEEASDTRVTELQNQLRDALEWNKQWLDYDQHRVAYVRAIMGKMLWLEKQLNEANLSCSKKHNEDHSDGQKQIGQMQEHYERLLQKAKDELEVLRDQVNITQQNLTTTQNWCKEREIELEELKQQLHATELSGKSSPEHHLSEDEVKQLADKNKNLRDRLDEERRRSTNSELQVNLLQKFVLNHQSADQEKIADLERQIQISAQDLEDERQDCSHLKKQLVKVLKLLKKTEHQEPKTTERCRDYVTASTSKDLLNESSLECPCCKAEYPVSHYQELMQHIEVCFE